MDIHCWRKRGKTLFARNLVMTCHKNRQIIPWDNRLQPVARRYLYTFASNCSHGIKILRAIGRPAYRPFACNWLQCVRKNRKISKITGKSHIVRFSIAYVITLSSEATYAKPELEERHAKRTTIIQQE